MSKTRIIINSKYLNENAASYADLQLWLEDRNEHEIAQPIMIGTPDGKIWAIRRPVDRTNGFIGEAIEVETEEGEV